MARKPYKIVLGSIEQNADAVFMNPVEGQRAIVNPMCMIATLVQLADDLDADVMVVPRDRDEATQILINSAYKKGADDLRNSMARSNRMTDRPEVED